MFVRMGVKFSAVPKWLPPSAVTQYLIVQFFLIIVLASIYNKPNPLEVVSILVSWAVFENTYGTVSPGREMALIYVLFFKLSVIKQKVKSLYSQLFLKYLFS